MPIYILECVKCHKILEMVQGIDEANPECCGQTMIKKPTLPVIRVKNGCYPIRSKGYKEGYKKEYLKSKGQEVWNDGIISP